MALTKDERDRLRKLTFELDTWVRSADLISSQRSEQREQGEAAANRFRRMVTTVGGRGDARAQILPLSTGDLSGLQRLANLERMPTLGVNAQAWLDSLSHTLPRYLKAAALNFSFRRHFSRPSVRAEAEAAGRFLLEFQDQASVAGLSDMMRRLRSGEPGAPVTTLDQALEPSVGLTKALSMSGPIRLDKAAELIPLRRSVSHIQRVISGQSSLEDRINGAAEQIKIEVADQMLSEMPVEKLRTATRDRLVVAPLRKAGLDTVGHVLFFPREVQLAPGVGEKSYWRLMGAARALEKEARQAAAVRIDPDNPMPAMRQLIASLANEERFREALDIPSRHELLELLEPLANAPLHSAARFVVAGPGGASAVAGAGELNQWSTTLKSTELTEQQAWDDFLSRPAHYYSLLDERGLAPVDQRLIEGELPADLLQAIQQIRLDPSLLSVPLRGYQDFAARFALVQKKVVIGDEMGLGKTIEALALLAHLATQGPIRALVICPAAVVTNWVRETQDKSKLPVYRLHGRHREWNLLRWERDGGVGVTTFGMLGWLESQPGSSQKLDAVIVDEAHFVKNPGALRSARSRKLIEGADHAVLMTGTPLENTVEEFKTLVSYVQPELAAMANALVPEQFRLDVAPAYLRRNQEDVLTELPELIEVDEWLPLSAVDQAAYAEAVWSGNFHGMRQAAMLNGPSSTKIQKLVALAEEAQASGRKVVVFSNYLRVLDAAVQALASRGKVFGPVTGSVAPKARQKIIDEFSGASAGAVLVSQVQAGGVGLNIQAASVVIIIEPQVKPTTEWQAIARAHRMGQLRSVQVHRLLSEQSVDERMVEILRDKAQVFEDFAAVSEMAARTPDAVDISEKDLIRKVIEAEQSRLREENVSEKPSGDDDSEEEESW